MNIKTTFVYKVFWLTMALGSYRNNQNVCVVLSSVLKPRSRQEILRDASNSEAQKFWSHIKVVSVWETGIGKIQSPNVYYRDSLIPD